MRANFHLVSVPASSTLHTSARTHFLPQATRHTLESAPSILDNPCNPDCSPTVAQSSSPNAPYPALAFLPNLFLKCAAVFRLVVFLPRAFVFTSLFRAAFFFATSFGSYPRLSRLLLIAFFIGTTSCRSALRPRLLVLVSFFVGLRAVLHRWSF